MVSSNPPLPVSQFQPPTYTSALPGATIFRSFDKGNWHYTLTYKYNHRRWHATEYTARRMHTGNEPPIGVLTHVSNSVCSPGAGPKIAHQSTADHPAHSVCPRGAPPNLGDLPVPSFSGSNRSPDTTEMHWGNYAGSGWSITAIWEWKNGHWGLLNVVEKRTA